MLACIHLEIIHFLVNNILCVPLEKHETSEGAMMPIYRDWDIFHGGYVPKMVYATTMKPRTDKGPILHLERYEFVTAIAGVVNVELLINDKFIIYRRSINGVQKIWYRFNHSFLWN